MELTGQFFLPSRLLPDNAAKALVKWKAALASTAARLPYLLFMLPITRTKITVQKVAVQGSFSSACPATQSGQAPALGNKQHQ